MRNEYIEELQLLTGVQSDDLDFLVALLLKDSKSEEDEQPVAQIKQDCLSAPTLEDFLSGKEIL